MDMRLSEIAQHVIRRLKFDLIVDENNCRLVAYDKNHDCISRSFIESDDVTYEEAVTPIYYTDWMLQIREPGENSSCNTKFTIYFELFRY